MIAQLRTLADELRREADELESDRSDINERISELESEAVSRYANGREDLSYGELADIDHVAHLDPEDADELIRLRRLEERWENESPEDEINDELADARREIAARLELILKRAMLDTADRLEEAGGLERLTLPAVRLFATCDRKNVTLSITGPYDWTELRLPEDLDAARQLRDFLIAALLPLEHDGGL